VAALDLGMPFRAPDLALAIVDPRLDDLLARAAELSGAAGASGAAVRAGPGSRGPLAVLGRLRADLLAAEAAGPAPDPDEPAPSDLATALLGWAAPHGSVDGLAAAVAARRRLLADLRRDDAPLTLATAHGTKGLEWDHVVVLADGFPGRRSVADATEPERALEEERRLAYVAWTRARRSLTLLYDPDAPPSFLREAFDAEELEPSPHGRAA
jgi:hypothetical protein